MMDFIVARSIIQHYEDKFNKELKGNNLHDKSTKVSHDKSTKVSHDKSTKVSHDKSTKVSPTRDKVCSQCGQQYHWCVCYLNEYQ